MSEKASGATAKHRVLPKLVMGHLEVVSGPDMEAGIPYDEAIILIENDEDSEIEVRCPAALMVAPIIVEAVNSYDAAQERIRDLERVLREVRRALDPESDPTRLPYEALRTQVQNALSTARPIPEKEERK